jgi:membrane associated rhomboid family serine protease
MHPKLKRVILTGFVGLLVGLVLAAIAVPGISSPERMVRTGTALIVFGLVGGVLAGLITSPNKPEKK